MFGHLVPCGGGKAVALNKPRLLLRQSAAPLGDSAATHDIELRFVEGWWHVRKMESDRTLQVNGNECESAQLHPNDVMTIGGKFYRITFQPPATVAPVIEMTPKADVQQTTVARRDEAFQLGILIPCGGGPSITLRKSKVLIGRSPECDFVLAERSISSRHCVLELIRGYWQVLDLESTNGTTVDGMTYHLKWVLPGSVLGLSKKRFRLEYQPKGERPALAEDDEVILPKRSLTELVGLNTKRLDRLMKSLPAEEPSRPRRSLNE